jgi:hypothetical protein
MDYSRKIQQQLDGWLAGRWSVFWAVLAVAAVMFAVGCYRVERVSREASMCEAVCCQLLDNTMEGRQGLVSSAWWPPLPVLLRIPIAAFVGSGNFPVASLLVSALFGSLVLFLLERILRAWNLGWPRFLMLLALALNPFFVQAFSDGSSVTTVIFFTLLVAESLVRWVTSRKLRFLVHLGIGSAILLGFAFEMSAWLLVVFIILATDLVFSHSGRDQIEAVLIMALLPTVYMIGLWLLMNWLIMGDALCFLRSLFLIIRERHTASVEFPALANVHYLTACVSLLAFVASIFRRNRAGGFAAMLAIVPFLLTMLMAASGLLWDSTPIPGCLFPLCILAIAFAVGPEEVMPHGGSFAAALLSLVLTACAIAGEKGLLPRVSRPDGLMCLNHERNASLRKIEQHVLRQSPYGKVFVAGFDGLLLLDRTDSGVFLPSLDFDFSKAKNDYHGHNLYLMVHCPLGRSAADSIHWKYKGIYVFGGDGTLYDGDFGDWRLFEIVQAPR